MVANLKMFLTCLGISATLSVGIATIYKDNLLQISGKIWNNIMVLAEPFGPMIITTLFIIIMSIAIAKFLYTFTISLN